MSKCKCGALHENGTSYDDHATVPTPTLEDTAGSVEAVACACRCPTCGAHRCAPPAPVYTPQPYYFPPVWYPSIWPSIPGVTITYGPNC